LQFLESLDAFSKKFGLTRGVVSRHRSPHYTLDTLIAPSPLSNALCRTLSSPSASMRVIVSSFMLADGNGRFGLALSDKRSTRRGVAVGKPIYNVGHRSILEAKTATLAIQESNGKAKAPRR
jgi:hypothetical protein